MLPLWRDAAAGIQVVRLDGSEKTRLTPLLGLFREVASEEGWEPGSALEPCCRRSVYFALYAEGQLAGGLQLTLPDGPGMLPCFELWPEVGSCLRSSRDNHCAHVTMLALHPAFRGQGLLFWHLVVEMWRYCVGEGVATLFIEVTPRVLPLYRRLGWPLVVRGERKVHWGEECYLCTLGIADVARALLLRAEHSRYYRQIVAQAFRVTRPVVRQSTRTTRTTRTRAATSVGEAAGANAV